MRPGIKAVLYDKKLRVLLCRLPDGFPHRFNFTGGGIDQGESVAESFVREFSEEMHGPSFEVSFVAQAPLIAQGRLPVRRDDFIAKYEYIIALPVANLRAFTPKDESKIICLPPLPWHNAAL